MLNFITLHGYLGRDPEIEEKTGEKGVYQKVRFSLGVSRDLGDQTDWFNCTMTGKRAEVINKFFHKGSQIIVYGHMESYKSDRDNMVHWLVRMTGFDFCDSKGSGGDKPQPQETQETLEEVTEDVPF